MKKRNWKGAALSLLWSAVLTSVIFAMADGVLVCLDVRLTPAMFFAAWAVLLLGVQFSRPLTLKRKVMTSALLLAAAVLAGLGAWGIWATSDIQSEYAQTDSGKQALYGGQKIMLIVPHEDDEANVMGGILEEYTSYGSQVYVVYVTNGDAEGLGETRLREAIAYCASVGIPEEQVIFLGYGDRWDSDGPHIYNAEPGTVVNSRIGNTRTYGLDTHPAYREGNAYTVENYLTDLENVILEYRPEVIFCSDYDDHIDHMATSLAFETVMGKILTENEDYFPTVWKGFAYNTAWYAEEDYYDNVNILSTGDIFSEPFHQQPAIYRWEDRVRFPVRADTLSRSLVNSEAYRGLAVYASQNATKMAASVVNGDRVFWQRPTTSLTYRAQVTASSGNAAVLTDFKLIECDDLVENHLPYDGVWIPETGEGEKSVTVTLPEKTDLHSIILYDHPSAEQNVKNAVICFEDGTQLETGALDPNGAATVIPVEKTGVAEFCVVLTGVEGDSAGLTELEAFRETPETGRSFLKLMDTDGNFAYDYCIADGTRAEFDLYIHGALPVLAEENYTLRVSNPACAVSFENGRVAVECPVGAQTTVSVTCNATGASDSIFLQNPGKLGIIHMELAQKIEYFAAFRSRDMILWRIGKRIMNILL